MAEELQGDGLVSDPAKAEAMAYATNDEINRAESIRASADLDERIGMNFGGPNRRAHLRLADAAREDARKIEGSLDTVASKAAEEYDKGQADRSNPA